MMVFLLKQNELMKVGYHNYTFNAVMLLLSSVTTFFMDQIHEIGYTCIGPFIVFHLS
jgi:hypothetical protein